MSAAEAKKSDEAPERTMDQIEADLTATRERLMSTVTELRQRTDPKKLKAEAERTLRETYYSDSGLRVERVVATAAVFGAGMVAMGVLSRTVRAVGWVLSLRHRAGDPLDVVYVPVPRAQLEALSIPVAKD